MKLIVSLLCSCFLLGMFYAQDVPAQSATITLDGFLGVEGGESFSYKLVVSDSGGKIKGHSFTWLQEGKEVQAIVAGSIDRQNRTLSFSETEIVQNKGFYSQATICLIQATLKYKEDGGRQTFSGAITSSDASNTYCGKGTVSLVNNEVLQRLLQQEPEKPAAKAVEPPKPGVTNKKPIRIVYDTVAAKPVARPQVKDTVVKITSGTESVYDWNGENIKLEVWDGGWPDGDIITILFDGEAVLSKYTLASQKKELNLSIKDGTHMITIIANNEGNEPPNTANLTLSDGDKRYPIVAYNTIGKQAIIRIRKK